MAPIAEEVYRHLRRAIITSRLQPGQRLSIKEYANQLGVSATPVREAFQMLTNEGLLTSKSYSGYFVSQFTLKQLDDMLQVRRLLEVAAAGLAAERITQQQLRELEDVHGEFTGRDEASLERYMDENRRFHYLIAQASGNDYLAEAIGHLMDRMGRFMVLYGDDENMAANHAAILACLRDHDVEGAQQTIGEHLDKTRDFLRQCLIDENAHEWQLTS